jgi:signal transduction histidine kinase/CheY-like chemotaxis protein
VILPHACACGGWTCPPVAFIFRPWLAEATDAIDGGAGGWMGAALLLVAGGFGIWWFWRERRRDRARFAKDLADEQARRNQALEERQIAVGSSQAKTELLTTLSHEIRAHLNGIVGSTDLMLETVLTPQQREHMTTLRVSAEALHNVLNDIVDYSRIDTGHLKLELALFDLRQPLVEVMEIVLPRAALKHLETALIVAPDVPLLVTGDAGRVRQVLLNLALNAVKFTARGRVALWVERTGAPEGEMAGTVWLRFAVADTGVGLTPEAQKEIFERFAPSESSTTRKFGGSGLELAISKRLVERMGGKIGVRSEPDQGSEFWFMLPLAVEPEQPLARAPLPVRAHVVVLDDLPAARVAADAMLARLSISHDVAATVEEAGSYLRTALEAGEPNRVLLLDESVFAARREAVEALLAEHGAGERLRVVWLTMHPESAPPTSLSGGAAVLRKPLLRAELLLEALGGAGSSPGTAEPVKPASQSPFVAAGMTTPPVGEKLRLLLAEDDEISGRVSSMMLERLGATVDLAVDGSEAIKLARQNPYALVFMDCRMPGMDGFEATRRIRAELGEKAPPIVALTANISAKDREAAFASGMCDFVTKPVHKAELARVLQRWAVRPHGKT